MQFSIVWTVSGANEKIKALEIGTLSWIIVINGCSTVGRLTMVGPVELKIGDQSCVGDATSKFIREFWWSWR